MAKRPIWSGSISFGLVNIPVRLYSAVDPKGVHFNMLHDKDHGRIQLKRFCSVDGQEVPYEHIVKGFEVAKSQYVVVPPEELKQLESKMSRVIEIQDFVGLDEIDPVYFESTYHLMADPSALKAFSLLSQAMQRAKKVGIAHITLRTRTSLCAVRPMGEGLALSTMNAADEVVPAAALEDAPEGLPPPSDRELAMAEQLIDQLSAHFEPEKYHDDYRERLLAYIHQKVEGNQVVGPAEEPAPAPVVNLMDALKRSLAQGQRSKPSEEGSRRHRAEAARVAKPRAAKGKT